MSQCPKCASSDLMIVQLSLKGIPTRFAHCRSCEHRVWTDVSEASSMTLDDVLVRAAA